MATFLGLIAALAGLGVSWYIYRKQVAAKPLMCPRKAPCETVIASPQSKTFGISNTILGMLYYIVVFLFFAYYATGQSMYGTAVALAVLTAGGFLFSAYLVAVQHFVIRQWCVWCLGSAAAATALFVCALTILF
jgi:uncharacterized membrane protein